MSTYSQIAIVEQHGLARRGLESLLTSSPQLQLVAATSEPAQLQRRCQPGERLDVIVYGAPAQAGRDMSETVGALAACGRVLIIADFAGWQLVTDALRAGAFGCVSRQADEDELMRAVETVSQGGLYVAPGLATRLHTELRHPTSAARPALARREMEALRLLASGLTHSQIGRRMNLTEATVSTYIKRIRNKLNVGNKADLTRKAIELGLLESTEGTGPLAGVLNFPPAA